MTDNFLSFFLISLLYCGIILGATYFLVYKKIKLPLQNIVAFSAGGLLILIFFDFLPHAFEAGKNIYESVVFIFAGLMVNVIAEVLILPRIKFLNRLLPKKNHNCHEHNPEHTHYHFIPTSTGCSVVGCFILCAFFDGVRLASAFLANMETMALIALGLLFHLLPESLAVLGIGFSAGFSRKFLLKIMLAFCGAFLGGYHLFFLLSHSGYLQHFALSFSCGLFLYICFVHLVPMVFKLGIKRWFLGGMLAYYITWQAISFLGH